MADLLVIPSARLVSPELQAEFGRIPAALIPLDGRPAVRYILDTAPAGSRAIVAAHEGIELLREVELCEPGLAVIDAGPASSLGATVLSALASADLEGADRVVVHFADTLVPDLPATGDAIAYRLEPDPYRWTAFVLDDAGAIGDMLEDGVDTGGAELPVFVGAFAFADPPAFASALLAAVADEAGGAVDPLYRAVTAYVRERGGETLHRPGVWHDLGHIDTYYRARQRLFIDRRAFNSVEVDTQRGVIRKRSTNAAKLRREVSWYERLPASAAVLAPRVLRKGGDAEESFVDLEFYGYPPLADTYLYGAWDGGAWERALDAVYDACSLLHSERLELAEQDCSAALRAMYETKTEERLEAVLAERRFDPLRGELLVIDGRPGLGLDGALELLPELAAALGLCEPRGLSIIHGDLCLSNILYDRRNGIVRLIDPRGSFGRLDLHGDPLYDHAKLAHSIQGDYDHLLRGLFTLSVGRGAARLEAHVTPAQRRVKQLHRRRAAALLGADAERVSLIEALLFLTMVPLHGDRPRSQLAFLVRGLGIVSALARHVGLSSDRMSRAV